MSERQGSDGAKPSSTEALARGDLGWQPELRLAALLFSGLAQDGEGAIGITRDSYGAGEQRAHERMHAFALSLGLEVSTDAALNLYMTMPGQDRAAPAALAGSHLDSVPCGGNFDGAAGVVAGLTLFSRWRRLGFVPPHDCTVMAIRAEESAWFPVSYVGSKAAFGALPADALQLERADTGRTLAEHMAALGGVPARVAAGESHIQPQRVLRFVEVHIEQGPVLLQQKHPIGIVSGIRGAFRFRHARTMGAYAHSGATPRALRHDAVSATARLLVALEGEWQAHEEAGRDLVITFGRFMTDPARADFSKVCGQVDFSLDIRSFEPETLLALQRAVRTHARRIERNTGVNFELGALTGTEPALMDGSLRELLLKRARALGISAMEMPSGAGHDAATFARFGVASAMIFVRNENGSHNPDEAMELRDFEPALRLLECALVER